MKNFRLGLIHIFIFILNNCFDFSYFRKISYFKNIFNQTNYYNYINYCKFKISTFFTLFTFFILASVVNFLVISVAQADVNIQELNTPKNIKLLFVEDKDTDLIACNFSFQGTGTRIDPQGKEGLASLLVHLLLERTTEGSDRFTLQKRLKTIGVLSGLQHSVDSDNIHFWFKCPKDKVKEAFDTIKIIMTQPDFDCRELAKMKNFDPSGSRLASCEETEFANKILLQKLLAPHPYAIPAQGTMDSRQSITIEDVQQAYQNRFGRNVLVFSVIGNIDAQNLMQIIDNTFGTLPEKVAVPKTEDINAHPDGSVAIIPKHSAQSGVVFGQNGVNYDDKDYLPMLIINNILGGKPFTSRLWFEIREKQGHVYSIQTQLSNWNHGAVLTGSFESSNSTVQKVIQMIRTEWQKMRDTGVTEAEFNAAKTGLRGSFVLHFTSPDGINDYILNSYLAGLPATYINQRNKLLEAVTLAEVNRVAKSRLDPEKLTFVVVGNPTK